MDFSSVWVLFVVVNAWGATIFWPLNFHNRHPYQVLGLQTTGGHRIVGINNSYSAKKSKLTP